MRVGTTIFFAFGTAFWYTAQNTTTWYQAHIVAVGLTMVAVGLALDADATGATGRSAGTAVACRSIGARFVESACCSGWRRRPG